MSDVYQAIIAVTVTVIDSGKILLLQRKNTGFMDGYYATPGGHLDSGETLKEGAARELKEETGLIVRPEDLKLFHVLQDENNAPKLYISFRFLATKWTGEPSLCEPEKSSDIGFFSLDQLPKTSPYVQRDIKILGEKEVTIGKAEPGEFYKYLGK